VVQEYSFQLFTLNLGTDVRAGKNPFTDQHIAFPVDDGLTDGQINAFQNTLDGYGFDGPGADHEGYALYRDDGGYLKFRSIDLGSGDTLCNVSVELLVPVLTKDILFIIRDIVHAGEFALTSFTGEDARLISRSPTSAHLKRWPGITTLNSMSELREWLTETIGCRKLNS